MAIINTLREKMGKLLVIVVGLSIMAFVLTDLLSNNSSFLNGGSRNVGEIDGEEISQEEFAQLVDNLKRYYGVTTSNEGTMQFIREQAWNQLVRDIAFGKKLSTLGLEIGTNERVDMVQGRNISPSITNFFMQRLGTSDVNTIKQYLQSIQFDPNEQYIFASAEQQAMIQRREEKFRNLLAKTEYVTLPEAQQEYQNQFGFVDVEYLYVPYSSVSDEQIGEVSDAEIRAYLRDNEDKFTVEESRSVQYVSFPVIPSAEDSASYRQQMEDVRSALASGTNDSTYAVSVTEQGAGFATYDPSALPTAIADNITNLKEGDIVGPNLTNGIYSIHKISEVVPTTDEFARASQIVFSLQGKTPADQQVVRSTANDVLRQLRNGESFSTLARQYSEGDFSTSGGDIGWLKKGDTRIKDIESAIFNARRTGLVRRLIETDDFIYIVNVTETKISNRYKVAQVIVEMTPSFETTNEVYLKAAEFASSAYGAEEFNSKAGENGYAVFSGTKIDKNATSIGRLTNARQVVSWLYGEASLGDVKEFDLDNEYVVAVYDELSDAGVQSVDEVRGEIANILKEEKKAAYITSKIQGLSGNVNQMATAYGPEAKIYLDNSLSLDKTSLQNIDGNAPEAIGAAFALQNAGDKTKPYGVDGAGVVVVQLKSKTSASEIGDYTSYENQLLQRAQASILQALQQSVIDRVEVTDERYKFY